MDISTTNIITYIFGFILGFGLTQLFINQIRKPKKQEPKVEEVKKHKPTPSIAQRIMKYEQISNNGYFSYIDIDEFSSLRKAEQATGFKRHTIRKCCDEFKDIKKDGKVIVFRYVN